MEPEQIRALLDEALRMVEANDSNLLEWNVSERCIATRLAIYLQSLFPEYSVDVEYNRIAYLPKTLNLPEACANAWDEVSRERLVIPDIIVHTRGPAGPNILVLELKKTTNATVRDCDQLRIRAFRDQLQYGSAALIECETRQNCPRTMTVSEWL